MADPLTVGSQTNVMCLDIRRRKGIKQEIMPLSGPNYNSPGFGQQQGASLCSQGTALLPCFLLPTLYLFLTSLPSSLLLYHLQNT